MDYFDQFSIFFWEDKLFTGRRWYPLGEVTTELLNLDNRWFEKLQNAADAFVPAAREMLVTQNEKAAPAVQEKLNPDKLPLHRLLPWSDPRQLPSQMPQLWQVFPADCWLQHLLLQQYRSGRDGSYLPQGGRTQEGRKGKSLRDSCSAGISEGL